MPVLLASLHDPLHPILVGLIGLVLLIPLIDRVLRGRFDPFEPFVFFVLAYGVMFVVRPAAMIVRGDLAHRGPLHATDVSDTFSEMLVMALVGAVAFVAAYSSPLGARFMRTRQRGQEEFQQGRVVMLALMVASFAILSFAAFLWYSGGPDTLALLFRGGSVELREAGANAPAYFWAGFFALVPAALVVLAVAWRARSKALMVLGVGLAVLVLIRAVPLGERIVLLPLLGGIFVFYYARRLARPSLITFLAVLLVALIGSSFLRDLRGRAMRGETASQSFVKIATKPGWTFGPILSGAETEMAPALAAALKLIPEELHHTYGKTIFGDLVERPVPRSLWNGKPLPPRERMIATLWPADYQKVHLNPEFSALLYFYWDFGFPGVIVGLALYGFGARALYEHFLRNRTRLSTQVFYSLALWFVVIGARDSPVDTLIRAVFIVVPVVLIFGLASGRATQRADGVAFEEPAHRVRSPTIT